MNITQNRLLMRVLFLLCLFSLPHVCTATSETQDDWYQVEVILFTENASDTLNLEEWPSHPALPNIRNTIELKPFDPSAALQNFQVLPERYWQLENEDRKLRQQKTYRLLSHIAWQQRMTGPYAAQAIHLYADPLVEGPTDEHTEDRWRIDGSLTLSKTHYINVNANLVLTNPDNTVRHFTLVQKRRLKPDELHYFSHPLFGMLLRVTKQVPPQANVSEETEGASHTVIANEVKQSRPST